MSRPGVGSLESLRAQNRGRVIGVLREAGPVSRAEIARRTGLSRSTISSLVADLQAVGMVTEVDGDRSAPSEQGGRPPVLLALDPSAGAAVGVDFGHRHLRVAVSDLGHNANQGLDSAARFVEQVLAEADVSRDRVIGVGMGLPGPIDRRTGMVGASALLPGWIGIRAAEEMRGRLDLEVAVDNDANLGGLAEWMWGAGQGSGLLAYIKAATGIGAGLVLGGRPYGGASGTAGEIGHTTIVSGGPVCACGNRGCLEMVAGGPAILELLRPRGDNGLTLRQVVRLAVEGDPGCQRVVADAGRSIGIAVANLCNLINPELIVVGGELSLAGDLLLDPIREVVWRSAIRSAAETARIIPGVLGERAELLGALALILRDSDRFISSWINVATGGSETLETTPGR